MSISFQCPSCGRKYRLPDANAGKRAKCKCGAQMTVPASKPVAEQDDLSLLREAAAVESSAIPLADEPTPAIRHKAVAPLPLSSAPVVSSQAKAQPAKWPTRRSIMLAVLGIIVVANIVFMVWNRSQPRAFGPSVSNPPIQQPRQENPVAQKPPVPVPPAANLKPAGTVAILPVRPAMRQTATGILRGQTTIAHGGLKTDVVVLMPQGQAAPHSLPCLFYAPAGSDLITGMALRPSDEREAMPYAKAGFAVVLYSLSGDLPNTPTGYLQITTAIPQYMSADGGLMNAHDAMEFAISRLQEVDPNQLYCAGHSSAATVALLFAQREPRIKGCVAFAPVTDVGGFVPQDVFLAAAGQFAGFEQFVETHSPMNLPAPACPTLIYHAEDDDVVPLSQSRSYVTAKGAGVKLITVPTGKHRTAMLNGGQATAIQWLKDHAGARISLVK
jgi:pimeloyl-ACP methyl ester carboxylesterase